MQKEEFESRTGWKVTPADYARIEQIYLDAGTMGKDEFCEDYAKGNGHGIMAALSGKCEDLRARIKAMKEERSEAVRTLIRAHSDTGIEMLRGQAVVLAGEGANTSSPRSKWRSPSTTGSKHGCSASWRTRDEADSPLNIFKFIKTDFDMNGTSATAPPLRRMTECQEERAARDLALYYEEYAALAADPKQSRTEIHKYLREKYGIHSTGTTYTIIKRVQERSNEEKTKGQRK